MNAKYEFIPGDEIVIAPGRTLKRIRALVAIAAFGVAPGDAGGYIESEKCLQVYGDAWVYGDARVYGNARVSGNASVSGNARVSGDARVSGNASVSGNARVYGDARVSGNASVSGDARVSGDAWVYGNARVSGDAWVYGNARVYGRRDIFWVTGVGTADGTLTVFKAQADGGALVTRGCFIGTPQKFLEKSASTHDERTRREYALLIEVALSRLGIEGGAI